MPFKFFCPNGHTLEGTETLIGQQCSCPFCQATFLVPAPQDAAPTYEQPSGEYDEFATDPAAIGSPEQMPVDEYGQPLTDETYYEQGYDEGYEETYQQPFDPDGSSALAAMAANDQAAAFAAGERRDVIHVPCPKGHLLEASRDMIGGYAQCPQCGLTFPVTYEASTEAFRDRKRHESQREERLGKTWLIWVIVLGVVVLGGIFGMIAATSG